LRGAPLLLNILWTELFFLFVPCLIKMNTRRPCPLPLFLPTEYTGKLGQNISNHKN
jgi:hypothetical protein